MWLCAKHRYQMTCFHHYNHHFKSEFYRSESQNRSFFDNRSISMGSKIDIPSSDLYSKIDSRSKLIASLYDNLSRSVDNQSIPFGSKIDNRSKSTENQSLPNSPKISRPNGYAKINRSRSNRMEFKLAQRAISGSGLDNRSINRSHRSIGDRSPKMTPDRCRSFGSIIKRLIFVFLTKISFSTQLNCENMFI